MSICFVLGWRQLKAEGRKFLLAGFTLAFAVAVVIVAFSASTMSREALDRAERSFNALGSVTVQSATSSGDLGQDDVAALRSVPGVREVVPLFFFASSVSGGSELSEVFVTGIPKGLSLEAFGVEVDVKDLAADRGQVLLTKRISERLGLSEGDTLALITPTGPKGLTVVGVFDETNAQVYLGNSVFVPFEDAQEYGGKAKEAYSRIDLLLEDGQEAESWIAEHRTDLPSGLQVQDSEAAGSSIQPYITALGFAFAGAAVSLTALAVWLIGIVFAHASESQRDTYQTFRQVGASRRWLASVLFFQSVIFSLLSGVLGAVLGSVLAGCLPQALRSLGVSGEYRVTLNPWVVLLAVVFSVGVGSVSTVRTVTRVSSAGTCERREGAARASSSRRRGVLIVALLGIVVVMFGWLLPNKVSSAAFALVLSPFAGIWAWTVLIEGVAKRQVVHTFTKKLAVVHLLSGRAMSTICALLSVLTCLGVSFLAAMSSVSAMIVQQVSTQFGADVYVSTSSVQVNTALRDSITSVTGVRAVSPALVTDVTLRAGEVAKNLSARVVEPETYFDAASFSPVGGTDIQDAERRMRDSGTCSILVPSGVASELGVARGGTVVVEAGGSTVSCRLVGLIASLVTGNQIVLQKNYAESLGLFGENEWYVSLDDAAAGQETVGRIRELFSGTAGVVVRSSEIMREDAVQQTTGYVALPGIAIGVLSVLGGMGAVALYALELRRRSAHYQDLLVLGATVRQLRRSFLIELVWSSGIGVVVGVLSGALGTFFMLRSLAAILGAELPHVLPLGPVLALTVGLLLLAALCTVPSLSRLQRLKPEVRCEGSE